MSKYQATSMMKAMPFTFEEVSVDRDNVLTLESNGAIQASELLGIFQVLTDDEDKLKCAAKVNLDQNRALYEIVFKNQAIKSKIKAMIEPEVNCGEHTCKIVENRDVKTTKKVPLTTVIIYEAPYELEDHHVYRVMRKLGISIGELTLKMVTDHSFIQLNQRIFRVHCGYKGIKLKSGMTAKTGNINSALIAKY